MTRQTPLLLWMKFSRLRATFFVAVFSLIGALVSLQFEHRQNTTLLTDESQKQREENVLAAKVPQLFLSAQSDWPRSGGLIALPVGAEPAVYLSVFDAVPAQPVAIEVFEADERALLDFLTHDKDGKQIYKSIKTTGFRSLTTIEQRLTGTRVETAKLLLPMESSGVYFVRMTHAGATEETFIARSAIASIVKEGDRELIFWTQDLRSGRSLTEGSLSVYSLLRNFKEISAGSINGEGVATTPLLPEADIAIVRHAGEKAIVPINLQYLNSGYTYQQFPAQSRQTKYFLFTDRPLYRPGDTIYFKSILRDENDVRYTIPTGPATVKLFDGWNDNSLIMEKNYPISADGTIHGEYMLPPTAKTGYYRLEIILPQSTIWSTSFQVEYFRKPEYTIDVTAKQTEFVSGDPAVVTIGGQYFSGQPLAGQKVTYTVYAGSFYDYEYYSDRAFISDDSYRYGYWGGSTVMSGEVVLDDDGTADITIPTAQLAGMPTQPPHAGEQTQANWAQSGQNRVFSVEAQVDDGSGNPSFSRKNILVYAGEYGIYREDSYQYGGKTGTPVSIPIVLTARRGTTVSAMQLRVTMHRENWIRYQDPNQKYPSYRKETEDLPAQTLITDADGRARIAFTPVKSGSYAINIEGTDGRGNTIRKQLWFYATADYEPWYGGDNTAPISIQADKKQYLPDDTARLSISTVAPNRDVFLSLERGRVNRYQIVRLTGTSTMVDLPLVSTDIPNIFAEVSGFSPSEYINGSTNLVVSAQNKKMTVRVTPDRTSYGPGESVVVNVETSDSAGNPAAADIALWGVDKALFELVDDRPEQIFDRFWHERYNDTGESQSLAGITVFAAEKGGGCFAAGTQVLMADGSSKSIEAVRTGDVVLTRENDTGGTLVRAAVTGTHTQTVSTVLILNGSLRLTPNHKLWVNGAWKDAGSVETGDWLLGFDGTPQMVTSIEYVTGEYTVYNLEIDHYRTYIADGIWVHNQKGGGRTVFKDTAYWNPSIHTDPSGRAKVSFKLPDNLTTWVVSAVGSTIDTKVGQTTAELLVTKDVIVRPILPNILRDGDTAQISALVQNFTEQDHTFDVDLLFDSGSVDAATHAGIFIPANKMKQLDWTIHPRENDRETARLTFSARSRATKEANDTITTALPVHAFGFLDHRGEVREGSADFSVRLAPDSHPEKSTVTLSLSATLLGSLKTAMQYLVQYPYGCVEQTTSRFVPAVIAKMNPDLFAGALEGKDIDDIIGKGIERLAAHQHDDGGWAWWYSGNSDPYVTAYVIEYLDLARQLGIAGTEDLLKRAGTYLEQKPEQQTPSDRVARAYATTILGTKNPQELLTDLNGLSADFVAMAVMANYRNGYTDPQVNGLISLTSFAKQQGDGLYWAGGSKEHFSSADAATALAIRAVLTAGSDTGVVDHSWAAGGARYLTRNRKSDYWSNTFGTAQVIRALVELSRVNNELTPNYTYAVTLDGAQLKQGSVTDSVTPIADIVIPTGRLRPEGSSIAVTKTGDGQLYSVLSVDEFHTDRHAGPVQHGISVTREYLNDKRPGYTLAPGDNVTVQLTVSGLGTDEYYGVIADELPAGMIPVNPYFANQQYDQGMNWYYSSYDVTDSEITENGAVLSLYRIAEGSRTYTYKARVVNAGTFIVPPASASLMYAPEIYGRTQPQTVTIDRQSQPISGYTSPTTGKPYLQPTDGVRPQRTTASARQQRLARNALFVIVVTGVILLIIRNPAMRQTIRNLLNRLSKQKPPDQTHQSP